MKKVFYHISLTKVENFKLQIPFNRLSVEDSSIERVCLSDTIEGCLSAVSWFGSNREGEEEIITEIGSKPIFVYEFELEEETLIKPKEIFEKGVIDAIQTNEYWYISKEDLIPVKSYIINLTKYDIERKNIKSKELESITRDIVGEYNLDDYVNEKNNVIYSINNIISNIEYSFIEEVIVGDTFELIHNEIGLDNNENFEDIIKSAFCRQLSFIEEDYTDNTPDIDDYDNAKIKISTVDSISYDKKDLIKYMNENGLKITDIISIT